VRVALAEDGALFREGLQMLLQAAGRVPPHGGDDRRDDVDDVRRQPVVEYGVLRNKPQKVRAGEEGVERRADAVAQPRTGRLETRARQIAVFLEQTPQARDVASVDGGDGLAE